MGSSAGDAESERVLREIEMETGAVLPPASPRQESQDWDEDAAEALRLVGIIGGPCATKVKTRPFVIVRHGSVPSH